MPDVTDRACPVCGATFLPYRNGKRVQRFCSPACGARADVRRLAPRNCEECGSPFAPKSGLGRYCSGQCRRRVADRSRPRRERQARGWKTAICPWCDHRFQTRNGSRCCSLRCAAALRQEGRSSPIHPRPRVECAWCGQTFDRQGCRKYCSQRCLDANHPYRSMVTEIAYGDCRRCGRTFVRRKGRIGTFCSQACSKRARIPVNSVDGGAHTRSNVALAHNRCNWERQTGGVVQLRLVG